MICGKVTYGKSFGTRAKPGPERTRQARIKSALQSCCRRWLQTFTWLHHQRAQQKRRCNRDSRARGDTRGYPKRASIHPATVAAMACPANCTRKLSADAALRSPTGTLSINNVTRAGVRSYMKCHITCVRSSRPHGAAGGANAMNPSAVANSIPQIARTVPNLRKKNGAQRMATTCARCDDENTVPIRPPGIPMRARKTVANGLNTPVPRFQTKMAIRTRKTGLGRCNLRRSARSGGHLQTSQRPEREQHDRASHQQRSPIGSDFRRSPVQAHNPAPAAARPPQTAKYAA